MKFYGKAPVRISLCNGGDTDYHIKNMGWSNLINATLSSGGYFCEIEEKKQDIINYYYKNLFSGNKIQKTISSLNNKNLIEATINKICPNFKGNINITTNIPEKSGLGGSSSLVVSLIKALSKLKGENRTPEEIAWLAYEIERKIVGINGGYQDQWAASFGGGVNYLEFKKNKVFIEPLWLSEKLIKNLEENLVLFYLEPREEDSGSIHDRLEKKFKKVKKSDLKIMLQRRENVSKTREALLKGDMKKFAELLNHEQKNKEKIMKNILANKSWRVYHNAIELGAISGKVSGAGSGGCAFFVYDKPNKKDFIKQMKLYGCKYIPLKLQRLSSIGSP